MSNLLNIIAQLKSRLPELELRLNKIGQISWHLLPRGLFRNNYQEKVDAAFLITDIQHDLSRLSLNLEERAARFVVQKIDQKMNVLLTLCRGKNQSAASGFDLNQMMTRQQWMNALTKELARLETQQQSLQFTLKQHQQDENLAKAVQRELNHIQQQIEAVKSQFPVCNSEIIN